jgi:hypothetical protein
MAAIDLSAANTQPWAYTFTSATTWQEFTLPRWCTAVIIHPEATGAYVAGDNNGTTGSPEVPTDGGAVGTHRIPVAADSAYTWALGGPSSDQSARKLFVAGQSGTPSISLLLVR